MGFGMRLVSSDLLLTSNCHPQCRGLLRLIGRATRSMGSRLVMRRSLSLLILALGRLRPTDAQRMLLWSGAIGVAGAIATIGFRSGLVALEHLIYGHPGGLVQIATALPWWLRLLAPTIGGCVAGAVLALANRMPETQAGGDYMESIAIGGGRLGVRFSLLRALSSAATVVSGGAIGREGPMVQLAALCGSLIGQWRALPVPRRRLMVACGAAAGIATAYSAPIAAALFVAEIVLRSLALESLGPLLVASFAAQVTGGALGTFEPVYRMPAFALGHGPATLAWLAGLGLACGLVAPPYLWFLDQAHATFRRWVAPLALKLAVGGAFVGALSVLSPDVWGNGYSVVSSILQGGWPWRPLLLLAALKLLAVAACTGSGAVGGIFTPTLFVGAATGALFGQAVQTLAPGALPEPGAVAIGMGAFLAACTHAPLTSMLMIFEMTENYGVAVPLMLACVLGYTVSRMLHARSIYAGSSPPPAQTPALAIAADLLRRDMVGMRQGQPLRDVEAAFLHQRRAHLYVVDDGGRFVGALPLHDLTALLRAGADPAMPWPESLLQRDFPSVTATAPVWQVTETFARHAWERLPVVDDSGRLLGYLTKSDLMLLFRDQLAVG